VLIAPDGARIMGDVAAPGPATTLRGFTFEGGCLDLSNSRLAAVRGCRFESGNTSIKFDGAARATIVDNDFRSVAGAVITGWGLDRSMISGNQFTNCAQCINLDFNNDPGRGRDIVIERNIFLGTTRMPIEVGPIGARTENLVVRGNCAADFRNRGPDPGQTMSTYVAYSIVPTYGRNSIIADNYAVAGAQGPGMIGIELDGSGQITGNHVDGFSYGAIVYGAGFDVHDNKFVNATIAGVLNYSGRPGTMGRNDERTRAPGPVDQCSRRASPAP
jgi:hypothetical protein